jgi:polysaccharide export outer membrane protein
MQIPLLVKFKNLRLFQVCLLILSGLIALGLGGCSTTEKGDPMAPPDLATNLGGVPRLNIGDSVIVTISDIPEPPQTPEERPIQSDGTISMPYLGRVQAAGKTPGELEQYIHDLYVPTNYTHITITVKASSDRVYFVQGEVKLPGRVLYVGPVTVTKAITSAGDFTDYANRRNVILTRSNGQRFKLNCMRIMNGDEPDPPVFPGDRIEVKRRLY